MQTLDTTVAYTNDDPSAVQINDPMAYMRAEWAHVAVTSSNAINYLNVVRCEYENMLHIQANLSQWHSALHARSIIVARREQRCADWEQGLSRRASRNAGAAASRGRGNGRGGGGRRGGGRGAASAGGRGGARASGSPPESTPASESTSAPIQDQVQTVQGPVQTSDLVQQKPGDVKIMSRGASNDDTTSAAIFAAAPAAAAAANDDDDDGDWKTVQPKQRTKRNNRGNNKHTAPEAESESE